MINTHNTRKTPVQFTKRNYVETVSTQFSSPCFISNNIERSRNLVTLLTVSALGLRVPVCSVDDGELHELPLLELVLALGDGQQLLDLVDGARKLHLSAVLRVLDRDEHVQLVVEVLPVGLAAVLVLLEIREQIGLVSSSSGKKLLVLIVRNLFLSDN